MTAIRRELRELIGEVRRHQIERGDVAVLVQVYNTLLRAVETEGRLKTRFDMRGEVLERETELVAQIIDKNVHDEATRAAIIQSLDEIAVQRG